jgi:hypothetical protein
MLKLSSKFQPPAFTTFALLSSSKNSRPTAVAQTTAKGLIDLAICSASLRRHGTSAGA